MEETGRGSKNIEGSLPARGKVQEVRRQWAVHEDGALAYQIQNEEISEHYGMNRLHRKMVRDDIPVAKFVQSEEELQQQQDRMRQLEVLKAQAEEDARVAKKISRQLKREAKRPVEPDLPEIEVEVADEELARQLQEKENKKYERHLEKKKEKRLKKERQKLEEALAKDLEEARLAAPPENGVARVSASIESLHLQGVNATRVTPTGCIEDGGDFSDFYHLPEELDEITRLGIQESQDEELARLLQEQEHKRTKAKVDTEKLRKIETQDEQLAKIMQEQEKIRLKKARERHQAKKEARRQMSTESMPLGASANTMSQLPPPATKTSAAVPINGSSHHRYRSNSYTRACDSPPSPPYTPPPQGRTSDRRNMEQDEHNSHPQQNMVAASSYSERRMHYPKSQPTHVLSPLSVPNSKFQSGPGRGMSTLESARQIAAGNPDLILVAQNSNKTADTHKGASLQKQILAIQDVHSQQEQFTRSARRGSDPYSHSPAGTHAQLETGVFQGQGKLHAVPLGMELRHSDAAEVHNLLSSREGSTSGSATKLSLPADIRRDQPLARSTSYSDEEENLGHDIYPSGLAGFNIAAAIDPTYQRRHPEGIFSQEAQLKSHIPFSRSLPQADGDLEWDPNLRGSLRKPKTQIGSYQGSVTGTSGHTDTFSGEPVISPWQPVQGQRRRDPGTRNKSRKMQAAGPDGKGNCRQQ